MSVQATTWVWQHSQSEGSTRLVLLAIADAANCDGKRSFQSAETIARMCKMSSRTVRRQIKVLQELGELEVEGRSGFYGTNSYRIVGVSSGLPLGHNHDLGQSVTGDTGGQAIGHLGHTDRTSGVVSSDTAMSTNPNTPSTPYTPEAPDSLSLDLPKQTGSKASEVYSEEFLNFWEHYPSTANKRGAFKAYKAALKHQTADELLEYLQRWVSSRKLAASRKEFVPHAPHAATWLNQRRWEDLDEPQQAASSPIEQQQQAASSSVDLTREDVDRILGQDYWVAPTPPEAVRGDLRAEREWTRQLAAEHAKARQIEAQRRLAAL